MSAVKNVIKDNYNMMLLKDYLRAAIKEAGFHTQKYQRLQQEPGWHYM